MFGLWPSCAYSGCWWPALFQFRNTNDDTELTVDLCPVHLIDAQKAVKEMKSLRQLEADQLDPACLPWSKDGEETEETL